MADGHLLTDIGLTLRRSELRPVYTVATERRRVPGRPERFVDVGGVAFMDSTALSALVRSKDSLQQQDISLRLAAPSKAVERIFSVTGFEDFFEIFSSREAAIPG